MSALTDRLHAERCIVDFAEDGVRVAQTGVLPEAIDELIERLRQEGLLDQLTSHEWVRRQPPPQSFDTGSVPKRRKGCLSSLAAPIKFMVGGRR